MQGCGKVKFERPSFEGSVLEIMKMVEWENFTFNLTFSQNSGVLSERTF